MPRRVEASAFSAPAPLPAAMRALAASAVLLVAGTAGAAEDFRARVAPGEVSFDGPGIVAVLEEQGPDVVAWRLRTNLTSPEGVVEVRGWFSVDRPRQVVPESRTAGAPDADWHQFIEVAAQALADRPAGARNVNLSGEARNLTLRLALPVNAATGEAGLRLRRDVAPPVFALGPVQNLTHIGFYLETTTDEPALATVLVRPAAGGEEVPLPTTSASRLQRFPVQGLAPNAAYLFRVTFQDWAGNSATSADVPVHTLPAPVRPAPRITARTPEANATLPAPVALVAVAFEGPAPRGLDGVQVFVDKTAQARANMTLLPGRLEVRLAPPLGPGAHDVGVELTSAEGGLTVERWAFTVAGATPLPGPAWAALALAAAGALARRR